ncbi:MAG: hypothetical protein ABSF46_23715 [Terriglobia bacterium]
MRMTSSSTVAVLAVLILAPVPSLEGKQESGTAPHFVFSCEANNDLYVAWQQTSNVSVPRYGSAAEAVEAAPPGAGVLILADGYPDRTTPLDAEMFKLAARKGLRLYVEFPSFLPETELGEAREIKWERGVVSSDLFGPSLRKMRILAIHSCRFLPVTAENPLAVMAKVAGYDYASFGLPKETFPILFELPAGGSGSARVLVSTTKLSQFITARYGPRDAWGPIWRMILTWLQPGGSLPALEWLPTVRPSYGADEKLPQDFETQSLQRGIEWYFKAPLLVHPSWMAKYDKPANREEPTAEWPYGHRIALMPNAEEGVGDGSLGVLEGFTSTILLDGTQPLRWWRRDDCNGEVAGTLALAGVALGGDRYLRVAGNIGDYIYFKSVMSLGKRADPHDPAYGLFGWNDVPNYWDKMEGFGVYYGDDNARGMLGMMLAAAALKTDRWNERLAKGLVANLRLTGQLGFQPDRLDTEPLEKNGWRHYFDSREKSLAPNYQAYVWASFLWAARHGGCPLFLDRTKKGLGMMMEVHPKDWVIGMGEGARAVRMGEARMLLPLAWLVRAEDTAQHRQWLRQVTEDLLSVQDACGAIREESGDPASTAPLIPSNDAYGTAEGSLIQRNGDPATDLIYTANFAFLGLHEAAAATGDRYYKDAEDRLANFLCRAQVKSEKHPELDGAWFRAFDFKRWEYWASNNDIGWGAWCTETGWMQSWITAVLAMRRMNASLWDLTSQTTIAPYLEKYGQEMLP